MRALAKDEGLTIAQEFIEKQSAKVPGRPVFNEMLARIEKGEARFAPAEKQWASATEAHQKISKTDLSLILEPRAGFEPATYALRMRCSTN